MKIYCLNLNRATERKELITQEWIENRHFDIEFFPAFDRRNIDAGEYIYPYDPAKAVERIKRPLTNGEIACATSHCLLLKKALEEGHEEIIVMEDDCMPIGDISPAQVFEKIEQCKRIYPNIKVLIMHENTGFNLTSRESKEGFNLLSLAPFGFQFVWLHKKAMEILLNDLSSMCYPADWLWTKRFAPMRVIANLEVPFGKHNDTYTYIGNEARNHNRIFIP
jgi:GR25 family glycosyltransferase involved in LPS biosynthesis